MNNAKNMEAIRYEWNGFTRALIGSEDVYSTTITTTWKKLLKISDDLRDQCHKPNCEYNTHDHRDCPENCCPEIFYKLHNKILWEIANELSMICNEIWFSDFFAEQDVQEVQIEISYGSIKINNHNFTHLLRNHFQEILNYYFLLHNSDEFINDVYPLIKLTLEYLAALCLLATEIMAE